MTVRARSRPAHAGVVIAGGGLAGQRACEALRRTGYDGPIRMIAAERHQPYDRPPLSKDYLAGTLDEAALALRPRDWYADHDVDLLLGHRAIRLDPLARTVTTSHRDRLRYAQLLIATGSTPRRLPIAAGYANVHELRTRARRAHVRRHRRPNRRAVRAAPVGSRSQAGAHASRNSLDVRPNLSEKDNSRT